MIYRMGRDVHKRKLKLAHAILHGVIFLFALIGAVAVYDFHNLSTPPKPNLYTLHSWIGLTTTLLFGCQVLIIPVSLKSFKLPTTAIDAIPTFLRLENKFKFYFFSMLVVLFRSYSLELKAIYVYFTCPSISTLEFLDLCSLSHHV